MIIYRYYTYNLEDTNICIRYAYIGTTKTSKDFFLPVLRFLESQALSYLCVLCVEETSLNRLKRSEWLDLLS